MNRLTSQEITGGEARWMRLRYFKPQPWVNRFTCRRRGAAQRVVPTHRPLLTNLYMTRIGGRP